MNRGKLIALLLVLALDAAPAEADLPPEFVTRQPAQLVRDAFAADYGRKITAEFGRILRASADPECLRTRRIDPGTLDARAGEILVRAGTRLYEIPIELVDPAKFEAAFAANAGPGAKAEYASLSSDPDAKRLQALRDPATFVGVVLQVAETADRHALLARVRLKGHISPLATGNAELLEEQERITDKSLEDADRFLRQKYTPQEIKRLAQLNDAYAKAMQAATSEEKLLRLGPRQLTPSFGIDVAAVCVPVGP
jgi:hypothetical protein